MKILRDYILKDFFVSFGFSLLILLTVMMLVFLMLSSHMTLTKGVNLYDALKICAYQSLYLLGPMLPFSFLMGVLLSMGRLAADNEIVAIHIAGISVNRLLGIFLIIAAVFSLLIFILNDRLIPQAHYNYRNERKTILLKNIQSLIEPGVFLDQFPGYILYVADKENNKLKNVFIYELGKDDKVTRVTFAKRGEFIVEDNTLKIKLEDGFRDEMQSSKQKDVYQMNFKVFFTYLPIQEKGKTKIEKKAVDMRLRELQERIAALKKMNIDPIDYRLELHKRVSFPFSLIALAILGFGISLAVKHREKSINFGIAVLVGMSGYVLFILAEMLVESRAMPPAFGMWFPNIILIFTGGIFFYKHAHCR